MHWWLLLGFFAGFLGISRGEDRERGRERETSAWRPATDGAVARVMDGGTGTPPKP